MLKVIIEKYKVYITIFLMLTLMAGMGFGGVKIHNNILEKERQKWADIADRNRGEADREAGRAEGINETLTEKLKVIAKQDEELKKLKKKINELPPIPTIPPVSTPTSCIEEVRKVQVACDEATSARDAVITSQGTQIGNYSSALNLAQNENSALRISNGKLATADDARKQEIGALNTRLALEIKHKEWWRYGAGAGAVAVLTAILVKK